MGKQFLVRDDVTGSTGYIESALAGLALPVALNSQTVNPGLLFRGRQSSLVKNMIAGAVMATPPTITPNSGTGGLAGGVLTAWNASPAPWRVEEHTSLIAYTNPTYGLGLASKAPGGVPTGTSESNRIAFDFEGRYFQIRTYGTTGTYRVWANEQLASIGWLTTGGASGDTYELFDFGSRQKLRIVIESAGGPDTAGENTFFFGGIRTLPSDTLTYPSINDGPILALTGDSYGHGSGATYQATGYFRTLGRLLGFPATRNLSAAGSGLVATSGGSVLTYTDRVSDVTAALPDILIIQGSVNDASSVGSGVVGAAFAAYVAAVRTASPNTIMVATGVLASKDGTNYNTLNTELRTAAAAANIPFVDTMPVGGLPWIAGTGGVGGTTGDGNADYYAIASNVHPSQAGHDYIAGKLGAALSTILGLSPSTPLVTPSSPPRGYQAITAAGVTNFTVPAGITTIRARTIGGGGSGGGGGSAAAAQLNTGGSGGAGGNIVEQSYAVNPGDVLTITVNAGPAGGAGGAAGGNAGGNGTAGTSTQMVNTTQGKTLAVVGGGGGGLGSLASSTTAANGPIYGRGSQTSSNAIQWVGSGGPSGFGTSGPVACVLGGAGGGPASATNGGGGGTAQLSTTQLQAQIGGTSGASATAAGVNGVTATQPGCGGGGGGGGAAGTGAGGNGGAGAAGAVELWW